MSLWNDTYTNSNNLNMSWVIGGDFNIILNDEEKIGGLSVYP